MCVCPRYVSFKKDGTLFAETNYPAGIWYKPSAAWLQNLYQDKKLSLARYLEVSATDFPLGHAARKRDAQEALLDERRLHVDSFVQRTLAELKSAGAYFEPKAFEEVNMFVHQFGTQCLWRRAVLLIIGGTNLGKSMLGGSIIERVAAQQGLKPDGSFLEVTVEGDGHLDFADFDGRVHAGVLLDGVGDAMLLWKHRETLQGRPKVVKGAKSATMKHAYSFSLCGKAVVATMDLSAQNLRALESNHWLSDPRNVIQLRLTAPAWQNPQPTPRATPQSMPSPGAAETMGKWGAEAVASFLEGADLAGPAAHLLKNGVDGKDLQGFDAGTLVHELRMTPFAAKKVVAAKDAFLRSF